MRRPNPLLPALLTLASPFQTTAFQTTAQITPPEKFFGFQLGADRKMARWDKIVEYFSLMEKESGGRMKVINMGPTSEGIPEGPNKDAQIKTLVAEGRPIVVQSMSRHATEIGGAQMAPELVYGELSRTDEEAKRILDNVISIIVPCFNPDGQIMVTDWCRKYIDTPYEGSNPPGLYQLYAGHDNSRDAFHTNIPDSQCNRDQTDIPGTPYLDV